MRVWADPTSLRFALATPDTSQVDMVVSRTMVLLQRAAKKAVSQSPPLRWSGSLCANIATSD